jgi:uncharacterized damage-inducible protein DinB
MSHLVKEVPYAADERETIAAMLDQQRAAVVAICDECSDDNLRARPVASDTTILGIVKHLAFMERWWFHDVFAGRDLDYPWTKDDPNAEFRIEENETTQDIIAVYAAECEKSRAIFENANLDDRAAKRGEVTLRWISGRMIMETARHAGQADILRELLDGATGLGHATTPSI